MKRLYISQPIEGETNDEIKNKREYLAQRAEAQLCEEVEVIESAFLGTPPRNRALWYLSKSLELLSIADVVILDKRWQHFKGCRIVEACAREYGIPILDE
jgi:hypothetical protein